MSKGIYLNKDKIEEIDGYLVQLMNFLDFQDEKHDLPDGEFSAVFIAITEIRELLNLDNELRQARMAEGS